MSIDLTGVLGTLGQALERIDANGALRAQRDRIDDLRERITLRARYAPGTLVVALAGTTGAGKSSLFNALTGGPYATVGPRRPTTSRPTAAVLGDPEAGVGDLLEWLGIHDRVSVPDPPFSLRSVILIDLPDIDSFSSANRELAHQFIGVADVLLWVVDPEKYADARVHLDYLRPMAGHGAVMDVVLNQVDRLTAADREVAVTDLRGRLREGNLAQAIYPTSVETGEGVETLASNLRIRAENAHDQSVRLLADARALGADLGRDAPWPNRFTSDGPAMLGAFTDQVHDAVGVGAYAEAFAARFRHRLRRASAWPPLRLWFNTRPTPPPGQLATARLALPFAELAAFFTGDGPWPRAIRTTLGNSNTLLQERLTMLRPDAETGSVPRYIRAWRALQWWGIGLGLVALLVLGVEIAVRYVGLTLPPALEGVPAEPGYPALPPISWSLAVAIMAGGASLIIAAGAALARARAVRRYRRALIKAIGADVDRAVEETMGAAVRDLLHLGGTYAAALAELATTASPGRRDGLDEVRRVRRRP